MNNFNTGVNKKYYHRDFKNESSVIFNRQRLLRNASVETIDESSSLSSSLATDSSSEIDEQFEDESESDHSNGVAEDKLRPAYPYISSSLNSKDNISRQNILAKEDNLNNQPEKYEKCIRKNGVRTPETMEVHAERNRLNAIVNKRERIGQIEIKTDSYKMKRKFDEILEHPPRQFDFMEGELQRHKLYHPYQGKLTKTLPKENLPPILEDDVDFMAATHHHLYHRTKIGFLKQFHRRIDAPPVTNQRCIFNDELITYHKSPVSLETGYIPRRIDNNPPQPTACKCHNDINSESNLPPLCFKNDDKTKIVAQKCKSKKRQGKTVSLICWKYQLMGIIYNILSFTTYVLSTVFVATICLIAMCISIILLYHYHCSRNMFENKQHLAFSTSVSFHKRTSDGDIGRGGILYANDIIMIMPTNFFQPSEFSKAQFCDTSSNLSTMVYDWDIAMIKPTPMTTNHQSRQIQRYKNKTCLKGNRCDPEPNIYATSPRSYTQSITRLKERRSDNTSKYVTCYCTEQPLIEDIIDQSVADTSVKDKVDSNHLSTAKDHEVNYLFNQLEYNDNAEENPSENSVNEYYSYAESGNVLKRDSTLPITDGDETIVAIQTDKGIAENERKTDETLPQDSPGSNSETPNVLASDTQTNLQEQNDTKGSDIPSFKEWTQMTLQKEEEKQKLVNVTLENHKNNHKSVLKRNVSLMKKNFASYDCGAKVIGANLESQGSDNVLSLIKDEYMLNKCADIIWFIVELCELIKAHKIELGNFEIYSSNPKQINIFLSNTYHGHSGHTQWTPFGQFEANDTRELQLFTNENGVFGKYVKIEIPSYYGNEHFCPISLVKVYGISEMEMIGDEDGEGGEEEDNHTTSSLEEKEDSGNSSPIFSANKVVKFIKEKVDETIERVVGVFKPNDQINYAYLAIGNTTLIRDIICPDCSQQRYDEVYMLVSADFHDLMQTLLNPSLYNALTNQICSSYGFRNLTRSFYGKCLGHHLVEFFKTLFGTSRMIALCNVIVYQEGGDKFTPDDGREMNSTVSNSEESSSKHKILNDRKSETKFSKEGVFVSSSEITFTPTTKKYDNKYDSVELGVSFKNTLGEKIKEPLNVEMKGVGADAKVQFEIISPYSDEASSIKESNKDLYQEALFESNKEKFEDNNVNNNFPNTESNATQIIYTALHSNLTTKPNKSDTNEISSELSKATDINDNTHQSVQQKESAWIRLSNRIKSLEKNVSLSGEYLEKLSIRYKNQIEDLQVSIRQSEEAVQREKEEYEKENLLIELLKHQIINLTDTVNHIELQMENMNVRSIHIHTVLFLTEIFIGLIFVIILYSCLSMTRSFETEGASQRNYILQSEKFRRKSLNSSPVDEMRKHLTAQKKKICLNREIPNLQQNIAIPTSIKHLGPPLDDKVWNRKGGTKSKDKIRVEIPSNNCRPTNKSSLILHHKGDRLLNKNGQKFKYSNDLPTNQIDSISDQIKAPSPYINFASSQNLPFTSDIISHNVIQGNKNIVPRGQSFKTNKTYSSMRLEDHETIVPSQTVVKPVINIFLNNCISTATENVNFSRTTTTNTMVYSDRGSAFNYGFAHPQNPTTVLTNGK